MLASNNPVRKQWRWWFYVVAVVLGLLVGEFVARSTYYALYGGQQDRLIRAFMGSAGRYNPNIVSNYVHHPYFVYALNPNTLLRGLLRQEAAALGQQSWIQGKGVFEGKGAGRLPHHLHWRIDNLFSA